MRKVEELSREELEIIVQGIADVVNNKDENYIDLVHDAVGLLSDSGLLNRLEKGTVELNK